MMKTVCAIIMLACAATAQRGGGFRRPSFSVQQIGGGFRRPGSSVQQIQSGGAVDATNNGWEYNFSWLHNGAKWDHSGAVNYCRSLPGNWATISINDQDENRFVQNVIGRGSVSYIWTSGTGSPGNPNSWRWDNGRFSGFGWSRTGGFRTPQPDNREGNESCLAILNKFYPNDGITWHDVACHHRKPTICERRAKS